MRLLILGLCLAVLPALAAPTLTVVRTENSPNLPALEGEPKPGFRIQPYLQDLDADRAALLWETDAASTCELTIGGPGGVSAKVTSGPVRLHEVAVTGLEPGTAYTWQVTVGDQSASSGFRTWPAEDHELRFFVYGDTRTRPDEHRRICDAMTRLLTPAHRFVLHSGDLVADGRVHDQWRDQFFAPGAALFGRLPVLPVPGNHERGSELFRDYFRLPDPEWYWALSVGPMHAVCLDFYRDMKPDSDAWKETEQGRWLLDHLASDKPWRVVMLHTPIVSLGPHGKLRDDGLPREDPMRLARVHLLPLLQQAGYRLAISGHDHIYERSLIGNLTAITSGGGGAPTYEQGPPEQNPHSQVFFSQTHFCDVTVTDTTLTIKVYDADLKVLDEITLNR